MVQQDILLPDELMIKVQQKRNLLHSDLFLVETSLQLTKPPTAQKPQQHKTRNNTNPRKPFTHQWNIISKPPAFKFALGKVALSSFRRPQRPWVDPSQRPLPLLEE